MLNPICRYKVYSNGMSYEGYLNSYDNVELFIYDDIRLLISYNKRKCCKPMYLTDVVGIGLKVCLKGDCIIAPLGILKTRDEIEFVVLSDDLNGEDLDWWSEIDVPFDVCDKYGRILRRYDRPSKAIKMFKQKTKTKG